MKDSKVTAASDPSATTPEGILENAGMTDSEKRRLLEDLKYDLVERLTATEENMAGGDDASAELGDLLRRVTDALESLD